ncbi:MAG TPA: styrene monooxygenase/indole monooxygenase family protein [Xanthomonadales bacterium]|nr:styrene monooxygenase/indole monooxygenase family protein [Xanthomonadales bacterium]
MRRITIVGAGQAGLMLGIGLLAKGYRVKLVTSETAAQLAGGPIRSTQGMFHDALQIERKLGLDLWDDVAPKIAELQFAMMGPDGKPAIAWRGALDAPASSVDQRLKFPAWMDIFERGGGQLETRPVEVADLDELARDCELLVVAAGKGDVRRLFARDDAKSPYGAPQRALAVCCVRNLTSYDPARVSFSVVPGAGEFFCVPGWGARGACDYLFFEAVPGGPLDRFDGVTAPEQRLALTLRLLETFVPGEYARCANAELTDAGATLAGRFAPEVRKPVADLPSGALAFGIADTVVLNDPITGQGSNNAAKAAAAYLEAILAHGDAPFDAAWMQATFDEHWAAYAAWSTAFTNAMLQPPPPHVRRFLFEAASRPSLRRAFVNGFDHPPSLFPWLGDPAACEAMIEAADAESVVGA